MRHIILYLTLVIISSSDKRTEIEDSIQYVRNKIDIRFFPEGGSLVDDISSVIAFKAVNTLGLGCKVTGEIFSSTGELVADFKSSHLGMGKFSLKPAQGLNYYAVVKTLNGEVARADIPKSFSTGVTFSYSKNQNGKPVIIVNTNTSTLPLLHDNELLLTISARKAILKTIRFKLKSLSNRFTLPIDGIPDGIAMLTLFASSNLPLAERLFFLQQQSEVKLKVEFDKTEYKQRGPVSINISLLSDSVMWQEANLSLSATEDLSSDSAHFPTTISSWFFLESDVSGSVEEPSYYFDYSNPNRLNDLDLLLQTQGWRNFEWKYDSTGNYPP